MLGKERTDVYCDNNTKHKNTLCGKMQNLLMLKQVVHVVIARSKRDGTRAETRFGLSAKRTSPFKSAAGDQFSRLLAAEECRSADSNCIDPVPTYSARLLATHSIRIFPLHFPSRASPCAIRI